MKKFDIIFEPSEDLVTYTQPIIRTIISVIVIFIGIYRDRIIPDSLGLFANIMDIILLIIGMIGTFNLYVILGEFFMTFLNRCDLKEKKNVKETDDTLCNFDDIIKLCEENDLLIVKIVFNKKLLKIGSSSDSVSNKFELFDKRYFIEEQEFIEFDEFKQELSKYSKDNKLRVVSIDDVHPKNYINDL